MIAMVCIFIHFKRSNNVWFQMFSPPVGGSLPRNGAPDMENTNFPGGGSEYNKGPHPQPGELAMPSFIQQNNTPLDLAHAAVEWQLDILTKLLTIICKAGSKHQLS